MISLPIDPHLPEMLRRLGEHGSLVLVAEPGAGKTTRLPPAILQSGLLPDRTPEVLVLQPRRVAARASATRIATENGWELGREVGYHIRADRCIGPGTRLQILTEGILTRRLVHDPFLERVGCVVLDEFHERHLDSDLCLAMLREIRNSVREDLRLVVMSATLDAEPVAAFLGDCPVMQVSGRMFPVELTFAPPPSPPAKVTLPQHASRQVRNAIESESAGDILVFLPGVEEIRRTLRELEDLEARGRVRVLPLHGALSAQEQYAVLEPSNRPKVILATNIAETSLTIDGVRTVIDSGLARVPRYDPRRGMDRLDLERISRASAIQRMGRAGRTASGRCVRLWSPAVDANLDPFTEPEVKRVDLCSAVLSLHEFGKKAAADFEWFERPEEENLAGAERLLSLLGALKDGNITPLGKLMRRLPVHPRLARLLIAAAEVGLLSQACGLAALLGEKDILQREEGPAWQLHPRTRGQSDVLLRLQLLEEAQRAGFAGHLRSQAIDPHTARHVARVRDDLLKQAQRVLAQGRATVVAEDEALARLLLLAYPDRVCRRRRAGDSGASLAIGGGVRLHPSSTVADALFFIAVDARDDSRARSREAVVRIASAIEPQWLEELFPAAISEFREVSYDGQRQKAVVKKVRKYQELVLSEQVASDASVADLAEALAAAVRPRAQEIFDGDPEAAQFVQRVAFLRKHVPEQSWPTWDAAELGELLAQACAGKHSLDQVKAQGLLEVLRGGLSWQLSRLVDELAPRTVAVPSGSQIRLEYSGEKSPVLAVRLQEVFGLCETPRIAGGRVPLVLHLLGPNFRPVQITSDLASFWRTTYFQVRKDLRVRYPKHSWPEDPLSARPEAKGRHRPR